MQSLIQAGTAAAPNFTSASAIAVDGPGTAVAETTNQVSLLDSTLDIASVGSISVSEVSTTIATATNVGGAGALGSSATAGYTGITGGIIDSTATSSGDIKIGASAQIAAQVDNTTTAAATSTAGNADGNATITGSYGLLDTDVTAGAAGSLIANLDANAIASTTTVGSITSFANATAESKFSNDTAAIYSTAFGQGDISVGNNGSVIGLAGANTDPLSLSATATTNTGNAIANALSNYVIAGIGGTETNLEIGNAGVITANAFVDAASSASTVTADGASAPAAQATTTIAEVAALGSGFGRGVVSTGSDATVTAVAASNSNATATSTNGAGQDTIAQVTNGLVSGINLEALDAGNNASLSVNASSTQSALASTVAAAGGAALDEATAQVAGSNAVYGIYQTNVYIDNNANKFSVTASLAGTATSKNVNGAASNSEAGLNNDVTAINRGLVDVGNSLTGGSDLRIDATSNITATAAGVDGTANSYAGGNSVSGVTSEINGIKNSAIAIGNSGNIASIAASRVGASSTTTAGDANAYAGQDGKAIFETPLTIGNDGSINAQTTLVGNAAATAVGAATTAANATANLDLNAIGIDQPTVAINIGDTGNVSGNAFASGGAVAQTTSGSATAISDVISKGISLGDGTSAPSANINISGTGSVNGLGLIGALASTDGVSSPILVTASAVSDDATAIGVFSGSGISGIDGFENQITAGAKGGDITGQVFAGGTVMASTIGKVIGNVAYATIQPSTIVGISDVDLIGGQAVSSMIKGSAIGTFNTTASSIAGDAVGLSDNNAYGIFGGSTGAADTLNVNGNVTSIAQLSNTVVANTVAGNADSTTNNSAIGLSRYEGIITSSGNLSASAINISKTIASSVSGNANA